MADTVRAPVVLDSPPQAAGVVVCRLTGEIDIDSGADVRHSFARAVARATEAVVLDCTRLEFCDSTLLNALIQLHRQAQARELGLALAAPPAQLRRLLTLTGTAKLLPIHRTVAQALRAVDGKPRGAKAGSAGHAAPPDGSPTRGPHRAAPSRPPATPGPDRTSPGTQTSDTHRAAPEAHPTATPDAPHAPSGTHEPAAAPATYEPAAAPATYPFMSGTHERDVLEQALGQAERGVLAASWNLAESDREALRTLLAELDAWAAAEPAPDPQDRIRLAEACAATAIAARQLRGLLGRLLGDCAAALRPALHPQSAPVTAPEAAAALRRIRALVAVALR
ncbi:anti-sigma factor antagonist [Streptomyces sp. NPDC101132]|uniref:STAS domain-containing protein n=1 Tax=Streptomyces sp. NPDC101132 TaxID=3366110 RepID=UPI003829ABDD